MPNIVNFYLDDSGARHPDHAPGKRAAHGYDWFALGGVLVKQEDEDAARALHKAFCDRWNIADAIHSVEIRGRTGNFLWLMELSKANQEKFFEELYQLMRSAPVTGLACVIDRPGYNARYAEKYAGQRWMLCKSAFNIVVERAAKHARSMGYRLRVSPERCNKPEDAMIKGYYEDLRTKGPPFAVDTSDKYAPMTAGQFKETLYELKPKKKSSPMAQFADLFLWPICIGGYHAGNRPFQRLMQDGKLIECGMASEEWPMLATKAVLDELALQASR
ncbi:DUF3800 domain-containing protein (plasmid) [Bradyrhizobium barranii subsp. apii]|uniref:DUF3800 domain-containing protein n=1 Tax=Bradyrhizobium barranii subsp. apii TaxID=2819348 RepID=A0A8T5VVD0_9BRAD|nr:DUF3800 domain-containing protein [Bradyrhizobium barranii]UPT92281.1 DUF3800 domain-containing protein [Bradyrhizobium barranii subsp. apii]